MDKVRSELVRAAQLLLPLWVGVGTGAVAAGGFESMSDDTFMLVFGVVLVGLAFLSRWAYDQERRTGAVSELSDVIEEVGRGIRTVGAVTLVLGTPGQPVVYRNLDEEQLAKLKGVLPTQDQPSTRSPY